MIDAPPWRIILGPPGTGKTTTLMQTLREALARGTPPDRIGFFTFTRQAAAEAIGRVGAEFGVTAADFPHFRTIHSLCMRFTDASRGSIMEGPRLAEFADWIGEEITGRVAVDGVWSGYARGDRMLFMDNLARIRRVPLRALYEEDHDELDWLALERFSRGLREYKAAQRLHDFTDLLEMFVAGDKRPALDELLVDESQDLSLLQWDCVRKLAEGCGRVTVAGDDDQAVFEWAGADVEALITLPGEARVLDQSYRIPRRVQNVAAKIINRVRHRRPKVWRPRDEDGAVTRVRRLDDLDFALGAEADRESPRSTLILARNRHMLDGVEHDLRSQGILYSREGVPSVSRRLMESIVVWERLRRGQPQTSRSVVEGPYELMSVGTGVARGHKKLPAFKPNEPVTMDQLREAGGLMVDGASEGGVWHRALDKMSVENRLYLMKCRRSGERLTREPRIRLSTIHGAKGGEADRVVLTTDVAPRTWREMHAHPDAEARVLYVGVTRAKSELVIVDSRTPRCYDV